MRSQLGLFATLLLLILTVACGGDAPISSTPQAADGSFSDQLPVLPSGPGEFRESSLADFTTLTGDLTFLDHNATIAPTTADLDAPEGVLDNLAWAMYQFPEPASQMDIFEVRGHYFDPDPVVRNPEEGYYVGLADYSVGYWRIIGPLTHDYFRIPLTEVTFDGASPGGFCYLTVFTHEGMRFRVDEVSIGYTTPKDYEEEWLSPPPGEHAGFMNDIQLDPAGEPQIAYLRGPLLMSNNFYRVWLAEQGPTGWESSELDLAYGVESLRFAIGDGGHRALLMVTNESPHRLILIVDPGTGDFSSEYVLSLDYKSHYLPDLIWISPTGAPGTRDAILATWQMEILPNPPFNDYAIQYFFWDGVVPPTIAPVPVPPANYPGRLNLGMQSNGRAALCVPSVNPGWNVDFSFTEFTPGAGWGACIIPVLLDVHGEYDEPWLNGMVFRELPSGEFGGAVINRNDNFVMMGRTDGPLWDRVPLDDIPITLGDDRILDLEAYPTGEMGYTAPIGPLYLGLIRKTPLVNEAPSVLQLDDELYTGYYSSMEVDSAGVTHVAAADPSGTGLYYYRVEADDTITREPVDNGGGGQGFNWDKAIPVWTGNALAIFTMDAALLQIRVSIVQNGAWLVENLLVETSNEPYFLIDAGYLESSSQFWVVTWSATDFLFYVTTFTAGAMDSASYPLTLGAFEFEPGFGIVKLADDETNVGVLYVQYSAFGAKAVFAVGPPETSPHPPEDVCLEELLQGGNYQLNYNHFHDAWEVLTHTAERRHVVHYHRNAMDDWSVPHVVAVQPEPGTWCHAIGLDADYATGDTIITTVEQGFGVPHEVINQYVGDGSTGVFTGPELIRIIDPLAGTYVQNEGMTAPSDDGRPVISIMYEDPALDYGVWVLMPEPGGGPGYNTLFAWITPVGETGVEETYYWMESMGGEDVALTVFEGDPTSPNYGQFVLYHPW